MGIAAGSRFGAYEIVALLGAGGMGDVYRARDTRLHRQVAIKFLTEAFASDPERVARFEREAQVVASLNHPNIAQIHGVEDDGTHRALVLELVEGSTLADRILQGPLPVAESLSIARQIADAVEAAHDHGVVHRDLKPANIKVREDGTVKVLDFGLAKALEAATATGHAVTAQGHSSASQSPTITSPAMTVGGVILGTAAYMSPEQARGRIVDRRADIWSFGVVLYEMLTGQRAFAGETISDVMARVIEREPDWTALPPATPPPLLRLLMLCLKKDPRTRLRDIGEARRQIDEMLSGPSPDVVDRSNAGGPPVWRRAAPWAFGIAGMIAALAVGVLHTRAPTEAEPLVHFEVPLPEETGAAMFELSPDGRFLAISAEDGGGRRLWLRRLDSVAAQALTGTEDATYPFWSPDSQSIAFFADSKLKKIAIAGGPPQELCDAAAGRGGTWSPDGIIVFAGISSGLSRVPAAGGAPVAVTTVAAGEVHRFPRFIPGSKRLLYTVTNASSPEKCGIYVSTLGDGSSERVLSDGSRSVFLPSRQRGGTGHLLFRRQASLMAQPFDPDKAALTGDIFPIAEQVGYAVNVGNSAFSVSGKGVLAYSRGGIGITEVVWKDRAGKRLESVTAEERSYNAVALSPDERSVAFSVSAPGLAESNLWVRELARRMTSKFTSRSGFSTDPVWSPDGRTIAFTDTFAIYTKPVNHISEEKELIRTGINMRPLDWSRDGKFLLYQVLFGRGDGADLWILPLDDLARPFSYLANKANETAGQFSPDGRWVAYVSDDSGQAQIYIQPVPANGDRQLVSPAGGTQPRWRRDGTELFYIAADQRLMAVPVKPGAVLTLGSPQPVIEVQRLYGNASGRFNYVPSRDGQRFLVTEALRDPAPIEVLFNWYPH